MKLIALFEHVINLHSIEEKEKYVDEVWDMLELAYKPMGGFKSATSKEDLMQDSSLWKLIRRDKKIISISIYKDSHGRKSIACATDGTPQGKKDLMKLSSDDLKLQRSWCECSGPAEVMFRRIGAIPLSSKLAAKLTKKEIIAYDVDGVHYTRMIQGEPKAKGLYGFPKMTDELRAELEKEDIHLNKVE